MFMPIFMALVAAMGGAVIALAGVLILSYYLALGDLGILLMYVVPLAVAVWTFIFTLRRIRAYISN